MDKIERFIVTDADGDPTKQISDIEDLIEQDIDLLVVNPTTADALDPILGRAMRRGVPVATVARRGLRAIPASSPRPTPPWPG
ncbi:MAG: substrate-binding domain-containing protein [Rhodospirillales bacterium]|nr:substrate-binding domain-containing protein [Rhodospirillales bacterium]